MSEQRSGGGGARDRMVTFRGAEGPGIGGGEAALAGVTELTLRGYRRYPWGGVEVGGILLGTREEGSVTVRAFRELGCEHDHGPAFELSEKDCARLESRLAEAAGEEELQGLCVVGWFHSSSSREVAVTQADRKLHERYFKEPWQVLMVVRRSKGEPVTVGFFHRGPTGALQAHSQRQLAVRDFKLSEADLPVDAEPEPEAAAAGGARVASPAEEARPAAVASSPQVTAALPPATGSVPQATAALPPATAALPPATASLPELTEALGPAVSPEAAPEGGRESGFAFAEEGPGRGLEFFGLREDPFSQNPDPRFFYPAPATREALAVLELGVQRRTGFLALIGEEGLGKSLVIECLIEHLEEQEIPFAYLFNSRVSVEEFFELLADDLDLQCARKNKAAVLIALNERLVERSREGQTTVLIIDNAQKLSMEVLEEVELLGNLETRRGKLLQVIFTGQPSFERLLDRTELRGLRQRMFHRAQLARLDEEQSGRYIQSRLAKAGLTEGGIFGAEVLRRLHARTQGIPRLINMVCAGLLEKAMEGRRKTADAGMLEEVCRELELERVVTGEEVEAHAMPA